MLTKDPIIGEYYNIGGTTTKTIREMLDYLISQSACKESIEIEIEDSRLRPIDADLQIPDTSKFTQHTGWKPNISFEETLINFLS